MQGLQRRLHVRLRQSTEKGGLPLAFDDVATVAVGSMHVIKSTTKPHDTARALDSYEETQLDELRRQWTNALDRRQQYLNEQLSQLQSKVEGEKTIADAEREASLIRQWMLLTEERNFVSVPPPNSSIPGAPADWTPPTGIEQHVPILFLDLDTDELAADTLDVQDVESDDDETPICSRVAGAMLTHERYDQVRCVIRRAMHSTIERYSNQATLFMSYFQMLLLPIVAKGDKDVC